MKRILAIILVAIFVPSCWANGMSSPFTTSSSQAEDLIQPIQQRYATINRNASKYRKVKKELSGFSAEGGELVAYFNGRAIMKIVATYYGESGRAGEEYYYWNEKLIFVFRKEYRYDSPMSGKVIQTNENRFYFSNDRLIRWVDENAKQIESGASEYQEKQSEYLQNSRQFTKAARSPKSTIEASSKNEPFSSPAT